MAFYWTDNKVDWAGVDLLEVWGVREEDDACEPCHSPDEEPHFWSVYVHSRPDPNDPTVGGIDCIADRPTRQQALGYADALARARGLEVKDYSYG